MLVLFAALPLSVLDLGWIVYAVETAADVYVFSTVLGSIANVASVHVYVKNAADAAEDLEIVRHAGVVERKGHVRIPPKAVLVFKRQQPS